MRTASEKFEKFMHRREWLLQLDAELDRLGWWREATSTGDVRITLGAALLARIADWELEIGEDFDGEDSIDEKRRLLAKGEWWLDVRERAEPAMPREKVSA